MRPLLLPAPLSPEGKGGGKGGGRSALASISPMHPTRKVSTRFEGEGKGTRGREGDYYLDCTLLRGTGKGGGRGREERDVPPLP